MELPQVSFGVVVGVGVSVGVGVGKVRAPRASACPRSACGGTESPFNHTTATGYVCTAFLTPSS